MTCVIGYLDKQNKKAYIASDSLGSGGGSCDVYKNPKIFKSLDSDDILVGSSGSYIVLQLLEYNNIFTGVNHVDGHISMREVVTGVIPNIRKPLKDNGVGSDDSMGVRIMIVTIDNIYEIQDDFSVLELETPYSSIGSGGEIANSSLYTTLEIDDMSIEDRILKALSASEKYCTGVSGPFKIMSIG